MKKRYKVLLIPVVALSALLAVGCREGACDDDAQPAAIDMPASIAG